MKKQIICLVLSLMLVCSAFGFSSAGAEGWEPTKPVSIINYVAAGGAMDVSTRLFAQIASKYTDATFVVDNKTGAGGLIGMDYVLSQDADGYTIFAGTISNIAAIVANEESTEHYVWGFTWIDNIMADPFSIMVRDDFEGDLTTLVEQAKADGNASIWCGPSTGGAKHVAALQFWNVLGLNPRWVPFESGPLALTAVLGGQGVATVGNPSDVNGRELKNLAIATNAKLPNFPDVPNFAECGYPELDKLSMWRGFAVKDGTPPEMIAWFQDIVQKVTEDEEWIAFFNEKSIVVRNEKTEEFEKTIQENIDDYIKYLKQFEMIDSDYVG